MDKYIIGITGNIGSGKSTFARWFADYNFYVIDMDLYAKNLYFNYSFRRKATDILGFDPIYNDRLRTQDIADKIYSDENKFKQLTELFLEFLPPLVDNTIKNLNDKYIVIDGALLFEYSLDKFCNLTICIYAQLILRYKRIKKYRNKKISKKRFLQIDKHQLSPDIKCKMADICVKNEGNIEKLKNNFLKILSSIDI